MLHDQLSVPQVVDSACAHEFLKEATKLASSEELANIGYDLAEKSARFRAVLSAEALPNLDEAALLAVLERVFLVRRQRKALLRNVSMEHWRLLLGDLLHGQGTPGVRMTRFADALPSLKAPLGRVLASELLYYTQPQEGWLWTPWLWDPATKGGALPLVLDKDVDLNGADDVETYDNVGMALSHVRTRGAQEGFTAVAPAPWGAIVYLACVYAVYMQTVIRMRLSDEFNRILPELPEFTRRMLGVYATSRRASHV